MKQWKANVVKNKLESKLSIEFRGKKELNGWFFYYEGYKIFRITIPKGREVLTPGAQKDIRDKLKLNNSSFDLLLKCPLKYNGYIEHLENIPNILPVNT